ncbi:MAG: phosphoribosylformylglycinamidine cyclo-ligase [Nitrospinota bacterium]
MHKKGVTYKDSGVDISAGNESVRRIKPLAKSTHNSSVVTEIGMFGGMYDLGEIVSKYRHPVLVQSIDSVGTKLMIANMMNTHYSIGVDMVAHSCNDILCQGARPITFLDYIAVDKLDPDHVEELFKGMADACRETGMAIIGGEIAELPGVYSKGEYDLVGSVTGIVDRDKIISGKDIVAGDIVVGLASSGLHTNGYSLARKVLFSGAYDAHDKVDGVGVLGEVLLEPHRNYTNLVHTLMEAVDIKGIAHITGGGLIENVPRILPEGCSALIDKGAWEVPPIFKLIGEVGNVPKDDLYRTLNMGIGMVLIVSPEDVDRLLKGMSPLDYYYGVIGEIRDGNRGVEFK